MFPTSLFNQFTTGLSISKTKYPEHIPDQQNLINSSPVCYLPIPWILWKFTCNILSYPANAQTYGQMAAKTLLTSKVVGIIKFK